MSHQTAPAVSRLRKYRPDLQGLRALAVIMVVIYHLDILDIRGGVILSFILSGFFIGGQLLAEEAKTGRVALGKFWARRFRRLAPGMAIVIVVTAVFAWLFVAPTLFRDYARDGLFATFSGLNWRMADMGVLYGEGENHTPYEHFWSLGIEEQFYVVFPLLLMAVAWVSRKLFKNRALVVAMLIGVIGLSLTLSVIQTGNNQPLAYFGTHTHMWELGTGVLLAFGAEKLSRMNLSLARVLSWVGLAFIIATGLYAGTERMAIPGYAFVGVVLGGAMVIAAGCANPRGGAEWLLGRKFPDFIGKISYGLYLWHWPVLILWPAVVGREVTFLDRFRILLFSLLLATLMFYLIEKRVRIRQVLVAIPWRGILLGGGLTTAAAAIMAAAVFVVPLNAPKVNTTTVALDNLSLVSVKQALDVKELPGNVQPPVLEAKEDDASMGCIEDDLLVGTFSMRSGCIIGDLKATRTVVVFGDSHAWQWGDAFDALGKKLGVRVVTITKGGCSPGAYAIYSDQLGRPFRECDSWRESAFTAMEGLHPEIIVVTGRMRREATEQGMAATFARLQKTGAKLVYLTDSPHPGVNVPDCLAKPRGKLADCNIPADKAIGFPDKRAMEQAVAKKYGATVFDVLPAFCTATVCPVVIGDRIVYYDDSHTTRTYALALTPFLEPALRVQLS